MTYEPEPTLAGVPGHAPAQSERLLADVEREQLAVRLQQAVQDFIESPRQAVEMADSAFDEATTLLTKAFEERGRALRAQWREDSETANTGDTEELRLALREYRDLTERLLHL